MIIADTKHAVAKQASHPARVDVMRINVDIVKQAGKQ
jgi:hypothetical protein